MKEADRQRNFAVLPLASTRKESFWCAGRTVLWKRSLQEKYPCGAYMDMSKRKRLITICFVEYGMWMAI